MSGGRSRTVSPAALRRLVRTEGDKLELLDQVERPLTRGDCKHDERPCPWVSCKYHLYLDVNQETGSLKLNFPDREVWELDESCALDIADQGGCTLIEVGQVLNLTRERIRQLEVRALLKTGQGEFEEPPVHGHSPLGGVIRSRGEEIQVARNRFKQKRKRA